jgi:hypothetical protein
MWEVLAISESAYLFRDKIHRDTPFWMQKSVFRDTYNVLEQLSDEVANTDFPGKKPSLVPKVSTSTPALTPKVSNQHTQYRFTTSFPVITGDVLYVFSKGDVLTKCEAVTTGAYHMARMHDTFFFISTEVLEKNPEFFEPISSEKEVEE